ncbi:MAG: hypothetical protein V2G42_01725 [bacterium JZ-2024 1]
MRWWGLCNALIQCAYLPATILGEIDPGKILSATDVVYQPAGSASVFEDALLWSYDFGMGAGIVYGIWAGVDASGSASREIRPLSNGDLLAPYYLAVDAQDQEFYVLGPTLEVRNPMTVAPFVLPGNLLYLVGFIAVDYNGNDAVSTPLLCDNTGVCMQASPRPAGFAPAEQGIGILLHTPRRLPEGILPGDADELARTAVVHMSEPTNSKQSESGVTEGKAGETG